MENQENIKENNNLYDKIKETGQNITQNVSFLQTIIIIILVVFLIFAILGINIFTAIGKLFQSAFDVIQPVSYGVAENVGYTTGFLIDQTSSLVADTGKKTIDIIDGTFHDIGNLFIKSSGRNREEKEGYSFFDPTPTSSSNPIQTPNTISSSWCLLGEYKDRNGCLEVEKSAQCASGQIFPSQQQCLTAASPVPSSTLSPFK